MECTTLVNPEAKLIEAVYEPAEGTFVLSDARMPALLNWVNSRLHVGRLYILAHSLSMVRHDLVRIAYRVAIPYEGVDKPQIRQMAWNLFAELEAFYDLYMPLVKALRDQKLSFNGNGQFEGPAAA